MEQSFQHNFVNFDSLCNLPVFHASADVVPVNKNNHYLYKLKIKLSDM
jgi:hypothetical protein